MRQLNLKLSEGDPNPSAEPEGDRVATPAVEPVAEDATQSSPLDTHSIRALHDLIEQRMRAPREAPGPVRQCAHYVCSAPAGGGAVRELCEYIMQAQGTLEEKVQEYFA